jgi:hypothetical protein
MVQNWHVLVGKTKHKETKKCPHRQLMSADAVEFCQLWRMRTLLCFRLSADAPGPAVIVGADRALPVTDFGYPRACRKYVMSAPSLFSKRDFYFIKWFFWKVSFLNVIVLKLSLMCSTTWKNVKTAEKSLNIGQRARLSFHEKKFCWFYWFYASLSFIIIH